jgi:hypothetical protein
MPIIDGVYRNPDRSRKYGLDIGDRVKRTIRGGKKDITILGHVVGLNGDNNRCQVLWDGDNEAGDEVAEWCCLIDENGLEVNNIFWHVMQNFTQGKCHVERMKYVLEKELEITEEQLFKAFSFRPHFTIEKREDNYWYYRINWN